jgi:hypothetical protein
MTFSPAEKRNGTVFFLGWVIAGVGFGLLAGFPGVLIAIGLCLVVSTSVRFYPGD